MQLGCAEVRQALCWLLDDELDADYGREVEAHVSQCSACRLQLEQEVRLRRALERAGTAIVAPARLRQRLREAVVAECRAQSPWRRAWPVAAAALVLLAFAWQHSRDGWVRHLEQAALRHARDLPMDVVAADLGQVQSYFSGKLPFAVRLPQLQESSVHAVGGRIVQLDNQDVAYVRFDMPRGRVSLFVYPDPEVAESDGEVVYHRMGHQQVLLRRVNGFNAAQWRSAGLVYAVISDLPESDFSVVLQRTLP